jgi:hypothetical protein
MSFDKITQIRSCYRVSGFFINQLMITLHAKPTQDTDVMDDL